MANWSLDPEGDEATKVKATNAANKAKQGAIGPPPTTAPAVVPATAKEASAEENQAAAKMQAVQRGNKDRKELIEKKGAATKMQAIQRGNKDRKELNEKKGAATQIQAVQRGNTQRTEVKAIKATLEKKQIAESLPATKENVNAATKLQAIQRGNESRKDLDRMLKENLSAEELAVVKNLEKQVAEKEKEEKEKERKIKKKQKKGASSTAAPPPPSSPPPSTKAKGSQEKEKRIDDKDGHQYTKKQFQKKYNGLKEWKTSLTQAQMLGQDGADLSSAQRQAQEQQQRQQQQQQQQRKKKSQKRKVNASLEQRSKLMQLASGIELKALPFNVRLHGLFDVVHK